MSLLMSSPHESIYNYAAHHVDNYEWFQVHTVLSFAKHKEWYIFPISKTSHMLPYII